MGTKTHTKSTNAWARFWAVDLHVHTPGSDDAKDTDFGSPGDIVKAAIDAGLDAIAVTDHNTAAWVERMHRAADGTDLIVLPGFELSTPQGHLLGVWEEGTSAAVLEDVLILVGITRPKFGKLDALTSKSMSECAKEIMDAGGLAIAAHVDKEKGILTQPVQTHVNQMLADLNISAFEYVWDETPEKIAAKLDGARNPALVQSSDAYDAALSRHSVTAIGIRRTWIKASRPDLCGLEYALDDPDLRVTLVDPATLPVHPTIDSVSISDGFLAGLGVGFSPDLNVLLGGTGVGKSLILEAIRFALAQQVDGAVFKTIFEEVDHRLELALRPGTDVVVELSAAGERYRVTRTYSTKGSSPVVEQDMEGDWVGIERVPESLLAIASFSQGEILEYARAPVGRVGLVDAHLDLASIDERIAAAEGALRENATKLVGARKRVSDLVEKSAKVGDLKERERVLSNLFDADLVKAQGQWTKEQSTISTLSEQIDDVEFVEPTLPDTVTSSLTPPQHNKEFKRIQVARTALGDSVDAARKLISESHESLRATVAEVRTGFDAEFKKFQSELDEQVEKSGGTSLRALRRELETVQTDLGAASAAADDLKKVAQPALQALTDNRETLLGQLKQARDDRRVLRRERAKELNAQTAGFVKIDIPSHGDTTDFRAALEVIKVGSNVQTRVLDLIAEKIHPYQFARAVWSGDSTQIGTLPAGVSATDISRLITNVADKNLSEQLLESQLIDTPDVLSVKFKKPEGGDYVNIEDLSHGQKCTAILVILLADGDNPVLVDQPEDALHAPWIEEYLVNRLRDLRGTRQYLFATRSSGLVVSADAEQLITMRATADKGEIEASGSLERHDLNKLALHHLEGGKIPFGRRTRKLRSSISETSS
ncbi:MAG: Nuclease sbcCD subunit [Rhodoglobus sp.]|nr:Nuclease sbcCD subunit [Rhodoglobus sp.]